MVDIKKRQFSNLQLTLLELYDKEVSEDDLRNCIVSCTSCSVPVLSYL